MNIKDIKYHKALEKSFDGNQYLIKVVFVILKLKKYNDSIFFRCNMIFIVSNFKWKVNDFNKNIL